MEKYQPQAPERQKSALLESIFKSRLVLQISFAAALSACAHAQPKVQSAEDATTEEQTHEAQQAERRAGPYDRLRSDFQHQLDPGPITEGSPLHGVLDELPVRYYAHNLPEQGTQDPNTSVTYTLVGQVLKLIQKGRNDSALNQFVISKLGQASSMGGDRQERLSDIYYSNAIVAGQLDIHWPSLEKQITAIHAEVLRLVRLEAQAAQTTGQSATSDENITEPTELVPTIDKGSALAARHRRNFDDYSEVQTWLKPMPIQCDSVSESTDSEPSSLELPEAIKALQVMAKLHLEAAAQRKRAYLTLQAYMHLNGDEAAHLASFDASALNNQILAGWHALLREERVNGKQGPLLELTREAVLLASRQTMAGEKLGRCIGNEPEPVQAEVASAEGIAPTTAVQTQTPTSQPQPQGEVTTGTWNQFQTSPEIADQLTRLDEALNAADMATLKTLALKLAPASFKPEIETAFREYETYDDIRKLMAKGQIISRIKFLLAKKPQAIAEVGHSFGIVLPPLAAPGPVAQSNTAPVSAPTTTQAQPTSIAEKMSGMEGLMQAASIEVIREIAREVLPANHPFITKGKYVLILTIISQLEKLLNEGDTTRIDAIWNRLKT